LGTSKLGILFATVAFLIKNIRQIIDVPCSMEEYFQEAGRAERDNLPSVNLMHTFYNSHDTSKA